MEEFDCLGCILFSVWMLFSDYGLFNCFKKDFVIFLFKLLVGGCG